MLPSVALGDVVGRPHEAFWDLKHDQTPPRVGGQSCCRDMLQKGWNGAEDREDVDIAEPTRSWT